jgi:hypothetical protein
MDFLYFPSLLFSLRYSGDAIHDHTQLDSIFCGSGRQVNWMCLSITDQVRSIADVTTAVARGDLTKKVCSVSIYEFAGSGLP